MYDIRQFRPTLYVLLLLGITGFALASQSPGTWVLAVGAILLNAWLVKTGRFFSLPRWIANLATFLAVLYAARELLLFGQSGAILAIGRFLVFLQVIKLYESRGNRDFAQLLVLSLLLMVAAAISTASLPYGLLLIIYLFLSLYCCLLFHLKIESETATAALATTQRTVNPSTLRQDQRFLSSSMRRLTLLVAAVSIGAAVLVFLFFPRMSSAGLLGNFQFRPSETLTGFSDKVSFQDVAKITRNDEKVADVKVWHNGHLVNGTQVLLLRGVSLNTYIAHDPDTGESWRWARLPDNMYSVRSIAGGESSPSPLVDTPTPADLWKQQITLQPTGTRVLFSIGAAHDINPDRELNDLQYCWYDQTVQTSQRQPLLQPITYTVLAAGASSLPAKLDIDQLPKSHSNIDPRIAALAKDPKVSGSDAKGSYAARRAQDALPSELDLKIAESIESYLHNNYRYTLDLTSVRRLSDQDPLVGFLFDFKRGHCEYFAGAMTLLCQSLGMQARMVVGFKCDEYNDIGHYYIVRQSHAHAWVEVLGGDGIWHTYDPTSSIEADTVRTPTLFTRISHLMDYLEFTWASHVVAYDANSRGNLIETASNNLSASRQASSELMTKVKDTLTHDLFVEVSSTVLGALITLMIIAMFGAIAWFIFERWRMRLRAHRIGLDSLPSSDQLRLARQLGFYADMMTFLETRNIARPQHMTPMEFAGSLTYLPADAYDLIHRITRIFYRIRYGDSRLTSAQQRRMTVALEHLRQCLANITPSRRTRGM